MKEKNVILSKRLQMLADLVTPGNRLADVGCDHGFLSIYLVQQGICPKALAMDVRKGPLAAAKEHIALAGLEDRIETRLSDGLLCCGEEEADTVVCAGMGGKLMARILSDSIHKAEHMKELILQPQSEIGEFRQFLRQSGFQILEENAVYEEGKYYFAIRAEYADRQTPTGKEDVSRGSAEMEQKLFDEYGELLLTAQHPVLLQYLKLRKNLLEQIIQTLQEENSDRTSKRLLEVEAEYSLIQQAIARF